MHQDSLRQRRYHHDDLARLGNEIYEQDIRPRIETAHRGEFVVIDVESGEFEVDTDELTASDRLLTRLPKAQVWLKRVGYPYIRRFGPRRRPVRMTGRSPSSGSSPLLWPRTEVSKSTS